MFHNYFNELQFIIPWTGAPIAQDFPDGRFPPQRQPI
jgi:hypothetical protein